MGKKAFGTLLITLFAVALHANTLSDSAKISILTCYPSNDAIYTLFGHTAIHVCDNDIDLIFNYGIFDFDTPGFIPKFVKGETDYQLGLSHTKSFFESYKRRGSKIVEQTLNLTQEEKQKVWDALCLNYEPENRIYRYNFVFDNCATRPCVLINNCCDNKILWEGDKTTTTYRKLIEEHVGSNTWAMFGIDLLIGSQADKKIGKNHENLFLPLYVKNTLKNSYIQDELENRPLVKATDEFDAMPVVKRQTPFFLSPIFICTFLLLFIGGLSFLDSKRGTYSRWLDSVLFCTAGIVGLVIFYLMCFSEHPLVDANWNFLWLQPLQLAFGILIWMKPLKKYLVFYQYVNLPLLVVALVSFTFHLQQFHTAFLPLIIILLLRSALFIIKNKA